MCFVSALARETMMIKISALLMSVYAREVIDIMVEFLRLSLVKKARENETNKHINEQTNLE